MFLMMMDAGVWCEDIVLGPELQLRREDDADHLMLAFDTKRNSLTIYFSCIGKGQVQMPVSLKELQHTKHSKNIAKHSKAFFSRYKMIKH